MYLRIFAALGVLAVATLSPAGSAAANEADDADGLVATSADTPDFGNPANADKSARGYVNPCRDEEFPYHVSKRTGLVKNSGGDTAISFDGDETFTIRGTGVTGSGFSAQVEDGFVTTQVEWVTACAPDESSVLGEYQPGTTRRFWITVPTPDTLFPGVLAEVAERLEAPQVTWAFRDVDFGWIYVRVDNDFRIEPIETVRAAASASNRVGSAAVWIEATPSIITFESGEPDGGFTQCTYEQATMPVNRDRATGCFYTYEWSSAGQGPNDAFDTRTTIEWDVTASHPLTVNDPFSWTTESLQVAEIQAVNTYDG